MKTRKNHLIEEKKNTSHRIFNNKKRKLEKPTIEIHYDRLYRFVTQYENLWGKQVHVSKGELASSAYKSDDEFLHVPFSHAECDIGALFEMQEIEDDVLMIEPKMHAPGTGVVSDLHEELVQIKRIFYSENVDKRFLKKIKQYESQGVEIIPFDFDSVSEHSFKLMLGKQELQGNKR